eukprot:COSAG01_NODE_6169_length_3814_cov_2.140781_3_plen_34_part_00
MPTFTPEMMKLLDQQVHNDVAYLCLCLLLSCLP